MNKHDGKWLDDQLKMTVNCGRVEFDSEQWKRKYPDEYKTLTSRSSKHQNVLLVVLSHPFFRAAAVIAVAVFVILFTQLKPIWQAQQSNIDKARQSPAEMMSVLSLSQAYRKGGLDEVDKQCKKAFDMLGQKNTNVSIGDILKDNDGNKPVFAPQGYRKE